MTDFFSNLWSSGIDAIRSVLELVGQWLTLDKVKAFFNSNFSTALLGSLAGAFAGAVAAQRIAEKGKQRHDLLGEIRATNAAMMMAFAICNGGLIFKRQLVKPMHEEFHRKKRAYEEQLEKIRSRLLPANHELHIEADLRILPPQELPVSDLQRVAMKNSL